MKLQGCFHANERQMGKETELEKLHYKDDDCSEVPRVSRAYWPAKAEDKVV